MAVALNFRDIGMLCSYRHLCIFSHEPVVGGQLSMVLNYEDIVLWCWESEVSKYNMDPGEKGTR